MSRWKEPWEMTRDESYRYWNEKLEELYFAAKETPAFKEAKVNISPMGCALLPSKFVQMGNHFFERDKLTPELAERLQRFADFFSLYNDYTHPTVHYDLVVRAIEEGKPVPEKVKREYRIGD